MKTYLKWLGYILIIVGFFVIYLGQPEQSFGQVALRVLNITQGGTGTSTAPGLDQILIGDGSGNYILDDIANHAGSGGGGGGSPVFFQNGGATLNSSATTTVNFTPNSFNVVENPTDTLTIRISTTTLGLPLFNDWAWNGSRLSPSTTVGIGVFASSTIGGGTANTGLTILGNSTTTGTLIVQGTATSTINGPLTMQHPYYLTTHGLKGDASDGLFFASNNGSLVADFGAGGGTNATFFGGVNIDGSTRLATSLTGLLYANAGAVLSTATTTLTGTAPIVFSQPISVMGASPSVITCNSSSGSQAGCLSSADWTIFNDKVSTSSINTVGELETLTGRNLIISTEIDESAELSSLLVDEVGTVGSIGSVVFNNSPSFNGTASFNALTVTNTSTLAFASATALTVSGNTYLGSLTGLLKGTAGLVGTASNGTDYTLITGTTCSGSDKVSAISALGVVTCSADQTGGGGGVSDWIGTTDLSAIRPTTTVGIVISASSSISTLNTGIASTTSFFGADLASCTGASNKITWTGGKFSCEADQTGGGGSKWTDGGLFSYLTDTADDIVLGSNNTATAPFWFDVSANNLLIGNSSSNDSQITFGPSSAPYSMGYDATDGFFKISTSSTLGTTDLFELFSTSTGSFASTSAGMVTMMQLRSVFGSMNYGTGVSMLPLDTLNLNGTIDTGTWVKRECVAPFQATLAGAAITGDTLNACGDFQFQEDNVGSMSIVTTGAWGTYSNQIEVANNLPNDGAGLFLFGVPGFGSSTPIFKTVARISTPANASNTQIFLGFTDITPNSTTFENFPNGCMFVASSTNANWQAFCGVNANRTFVDTGVPSTTSQTVNAGQFYRFSIYADATKVRFYIATPTASQRLVAEIANTLGTGLTAYGPATYFNTQRGGGGNRGIDVKYISVAYNLGI